nr:hypothetical protein BAU18_14045 [Enterococcus diestrammenae]
MNNLQTVLAFGQGALCFVRGLSTIACSQPFLSIGTAVFGFSRCVNAWVWIFCFRKRTVFENVMTEQDVWMLWTPYPKKLVFRGVLMLGSGFSVFEREPFSKTP